MAALDEKAWIMALVGGILGIIAVFSPISMYIGSGVFLGIFTFGFYIIFDPGFDFGIIDMEFVIIGSIISVLLLVFAIMLLITAIVGKKSSAKAIPILWIVSGVFLILIPTVSIILIIIIAKFLIFGYWIGPALIFPYIAAFLSIFSAIVKLRR